MTSEQIRRLASSERVARHAGFWWGFAEGVFLFIVPDVYITFAALFALRAGAVAWLFSIVGSLVAVPVIYVLTVVLDLDYLAFLTALPAISPSMIEGVSVMVAEDGGLPYTPFLALGGVPLKVYASVALSLGLPLAAVLLWTAFARVVRIAPTYALAAMARWMFGRHVDAHARAWALVFVVVWGVFYAFYFVRMGG